MIIRNRKDYADYGVMQTVGSGLEISFFIFPHFFNIKKDRLYSISSGINVKIASENYIRNGLVMLQRQYIFIIFQDLTLLFSTVYLIDKIGI